MGLFSFLKKKKDDQAAQPAEQAAEQQLDKKLNRTRGRFKDNLLNLVLGSKKIDAELLEELESQLIMADLGVAVTERVMEAIRKRLPRSDVNDPDALRQALHEELASILQAVEAPLEIPERSDPFVILVVGVNGSGKTTTIGKLARQLREGGQLSLIHI